MCCLLIPLVRSREIPVSDPSVSGACQQRAQVADRLIHATQVFLDVDVDQSVRVIEGHENLLKRDLPPAPFPSAETHGPGRFTAYCG